MERVAAVHLREGIESFLRFAKGRLWREASQRERLHALSVAARRGALDAMRESERRYREQDANRLYYLSMEFLMGRSLGNMLMNLGIYDEARNVIAEVGVDFDELQALEPDAALGNGSLGRLRRSAARHPPCRSGHPPCRSATRPRRSATFTSRTPILASSQRVAVLAQSEVLLVAARRRSRAA